MFNQYEESKDFTKSILPCLADKRVYKSLLASTSTNLAIIKIPTRQFKNNPALLFGKESYLTGTIVLEKHLGTPDGADTPFYSYIDGDAYSLIKRMRVLHGSTVISDINYFAQYAHCEDDMTLSPADKYSRSITHATADVPYNHISPTVTVTIPNPVVPGDIVGVITNTEVFQNQGIVASQMGYSPTYNTTALSYGLGFAYIPFSINLKNFLGDALDSPIPLHLLTNNDIIIEIELDNCANVQISDNVNNQIESMCVSELQYNAVITKIPWQVSQLLFPNNETTIIGIDKRNDIKYITPGATTINIQYDNFKYHYARSILFFFQNYAERNNRGRTFITQRYKGYIYSYALMYNNVTYPSKRIDNVSEMFDQGLKCFDSKKSSLTYLPYSNNDLTSNDLLTNPNSVTDYIAPEYQLTCRYVGAVNLQRYHSEDKHFKGVDISNTALTLNIELANVEYNGTGFKKITPQGISINDCYLISYCLYDVRYHIKDGEIKVID